MSFIDTKYSVELYNTDSSLDLRTKEDELTSVLKHIKKLFIGLILFEIKNIDQHSLIVEVKERDGEWHKNFGKLLANDYNMRVFCKEGQSNMMFKWRNIL